jgi:hypothetical protein
MEKKYSIALDVDGRDRQSLFNVVSDEDDDGE